MFLGCETCPGGAAYPRLMRAEVVQRKLVQALLVRLVVLSGYAPMDRRTATASTSYFKLGGRQSVMVVRAGTGAGKYPR